MGIEAHHNPKTWVTLASAAIGAVALIVAAAIGVDAKHDRETYSTLSAEKDSEIRRLQEQLQAHEVNPSNQDQFEIQIATLKAALAEKEAEILRLKGLKGSE